MRAGLESYLGQNGYGADADFPSVAPISKKPIRRPRPTAANKKPGDKQTKTRKPATGCPVKKPKPYAAVTTLGDKQDEKAVTKRAARGTKATMAAAEHALKQ